MCFRLDQESGAVKDTETPTDVIDAILIEMAVTHLHMTEAQEATMKSRLLAILDPAAGVGNDPQEMSRLFREAVKAA